MTWETPAEQRLRAKSAGCDFGCETAGIANAGGIV